MLSTLKVGAAPAVPWPPAHARGGASRPRGSSPWWLSAPVPPPPPLRGAVEPAPALEVASSIAWDSLHRSAIISAISDQHQRRPGLSSLRGLVQWSRGIIVASVGSSDTRHFSVVVCLQLLELS